MNNLLLVGRSTVGFAGRLTTAASTTPRPKSISLQPNCPGANPPRGEIQYEHHQRYKPSLLSLSRVDCRLLCSPMNLSRDDIVRRRRVTSLPRLVLESVYPLPGSRSKRNDTAELFSCCSMTLNGRKNRSTKLPCVPWPSSLSAVVAP